MYNPGIEITTKIGCKNACVYCPQSKFINSYRRKSNVMDMSFETFKACLDKLPLGVEIYFSGLCEPWLNPECTKMVLYAHERAHKIIVYTTLVGMNLSDIDLLERVLFTHFNVHLPAGGEYDKIKVDEYYLDLLNRILKSKINIRYHFHGVRLDPKVKILTEQNGKTVEYVPMYVGNRDKIQRLPVYSRARNVKVKNRFGLYRRRGIIGCKYNLRINQLLPNGDVLLCCMDYGMKHVLGNLLTSSYNSLFRSEAFLKAKAGLKDEALDILCRYCDWISYDVSLFAKIYNFPHYINRYLYYLKNIHNLREFHQVMDKSILRLREILNF
jgi:sulfatase maturation enzyme AslB (radical SAM superfamily)